VGLPPSTTILLDGPGSSATCSLIVYDHEFWNRSVLAEDRCGWTFLDLHAEHRNFKSVIGRCPVHTLQDGPRAGVDDGLGRSSGDDAVHSSIVTGYGSMLLRAISWRRPQFRVAHPSANRKQVTTRGIHHHHRVAMHSQFAKAFIKWRLRRKSEITS